MLIVIWPVLLAMAVFDWRVWHDCDNGWVTGPATDMFAMLAIACIAVPMTVLGIRGKPREAGEISGYLFILLGIAALYIGIKYLWTNEIRDVIDLL